MSKECRRISFDRFDRRQLGNAQTGAQAAGRVSNVLERRVYIAMQFLNVMGRSPGGRLLRLGPDAFDRVEFGRIGREVENVQARVGCDEGLDQFADMNPVVIPQPDNRTFDRAQQLVEKRHDVLAIDILPLQPTAQAQAPTVGGDQQRAQRIDPLVVRDLGADDGRLAPGRPGALERRNQGKTALIFKRQRRAQGAPLFLSAANRFRSRTQWPRHPAGPLAGWASGCSTPCAAAPTTRHSDGSAPQTASKSDGRSDPGSNDLPHTLAPVRPVSVAAPGAVPAAPSGVAWVRGVSARGADPLARPWPTVAPSARSCLSAKRPAWRSARRAAGPIRAGAVRRLVDCCPGFAWTPFSPIRHSFIKDQ